MSFFGWKKNKLKFLGITLFRIKIVKNIFVLYVVGIPILKISNRSNVIANKFAINKSFNTKVFDEEIASLVNNIKLKQSPQKNKSGKIAFIATEICDMGGHTKCIKDLINSLFGIYKQKLFLTQKWRSRDIAPLNYSLISTKISVKGINASIFDFTKGVKSFTQDIINFSPTAIFVLIHPHDVFATAVISLIKKTTNIKIIYFNHASHYPVLGMSFADIILEGIPTTEKITNEKRGFKNTKIIGLQSLAKDETIYYTKTQLDNLKKTMGISSDSLITMSGASSYKFFDNEDSSYFELIKNLLEEEAKLVHIMISEFNDKQKSIIKKIFEGSEALHRLIIIPYQTDFDKYFQCADVFIDSFPVSSALTQIDLMRNKVASVVKINKENPEFSFHEYQMTNYPYMFEDVKDMKSAILELLHNKEKREEIIAKNYDFWLHNYEANIFKQKLINLIDEDQHE